MCITSVINAKPQQTNWMILNVKRSALGKIRKIRALSGSNPILMTIKRKLKWKGQCCKNWELRQLFSSSVQQILIPIMAKLLANKCVPREWIYISLDLFTKIGSKSNYYSWSLVLWQGICVSKAHKPVTLSGNATFTKV